MGGGVSGGVEWWGERGRVEKWGGAEGGTGGEGHGDGVEGREGWQG